MPPVFIGVLYHWLGGLASGSFYVPYRFVKKWSWEVYWLAGGFVSWIIAPWVLALCLTESLVPTITTTWAIDPRSVCLAFLFGMMWGIGGLTFGLTMRYLGMSLGMAVALGYCTVLGTLMPPIFQGTFVTDVLSSPAGWVNLFGLGICALGIALAGAAGMSKEREMTEEAKKESIKEFSFAKGIIVATISGIFSAGMAYGMAAAAPIATTSQHYGTPELWVGLPKLCVILLGGFCTNFIWCMILLLKNGTLYQFFVPRVKEEVVEADGNKVISEAKVSMSWNYFFSALAGFTWYMQFFFYSMGETKMGEFQFSSWTLHMASIIIFSSLWGIALKEWKGTSRLTKFLLALGIGTLLYSTIVVGYSNFMNADSSKISVSVERLDAKDNEAEPNHVGKYVTTRFLNDTELQKEEKKIADRKTRKADDEKRKIEIEELLKKQTGSAPETRPSEPK